MSYLNSYLEKLKYFGLEELSDSVGKTADEISNNEISTFIFTKDKVGLLLGLVQSGKTSQTFGIISAAADEDFLIFILLTSDNVFLHKQTFQRAQRQLEEFNVYDEDDHLRFIENALKKPSLIVLKKNTKILRKWHRTLASSKLCHGNPLFIIDDEGDEASPNNKVNINSISAINRHLLGIRDLSTSCFYLQVTATPQALLLQTLASGWKPDFIKYVPPGQNYLGGDFFFNGESGSPCIKFTDDNEIEDLLSDDEFASNGLQKALCCFLVAGAHILSNKPSGVCNFVVHPSVRITHHELIAEKIGDYLNNILIQFQEGTFQANLLEAWQDISLTKRDLLPFESISEFIASALSENRINVVTMNSKSEIYEFNSGLNIIVGGNSLSRGITFPGLQTVYYSRKSVKFQADTYWQHSRMFGYDRDKDLMRVFIPPLLYKIFSDINRANNSLISQVLRYKPDEISLLYPPRIKPTRSSVVDKSNLIFITGDVNYFPFFPVNLDLDKLDRLLENFSGDQFYLCNLNLLLCILSEVNSSDPDDWSSKSFTDFIKSYKAGKPGEQGILIVRRNRDISKGTGTLLSPDDRDLVKSFKDKIVLVMYRVTGTIEKGWEGNPLWVPNIKFPEKVDFFKIK